MKRTVDRQATDRPTDRSTVKNRRASPFIRSLDDLLASRLHNFGTDFPNASEMRTFAAVVGVKLVLPLVLLAEEVVVQRGAFTLVTRSPCFQFYLQIAL